MYSKFAKTLAKIPPIEREFIHAIQKFSWQTLILLSAFSWLMTFTVLIFFESVTVTQRITEVCGWFFFIFGIGWLAADKRWRIGKFYFWPWITGTFISLFLFRMFGNDWPALPWTIWPQICVFVAVLPDLLRTQFRFAEMPLPARKKLILWGLVSIVISCWVQFSFLIQDWLGDYPNLLADNFEKSAFVMRVREPEANIASRGFEILDSTEAYLKIQVNNRDWSEVEIWITEDLKKIDQAVKQRMIDLEENQFWKIQGQVVPRVAGYNIDLIASWNGPSSRKEGYYQKKSCQVTRIYQQPKQPAPTNNNSQNKPQPVAALAVGQIECDFTTQPIYELINLNDAENQESN